MKNMKPAGGPDQTDEDLSLSLTRCSMTFRFLLVFAVLTLSLPESLVVRLLNKTLTAVGILVASEPYSCTVSGAMRPAWGKQSQPQRDTNASAKRRIVVLGDSITKGVRAGVTLPETYGEILRGELNKAGIDAEVINQGIGGERTDQALARLSRDILALKPDIVTVMYGTNDSYADKGKSHSRLTIEQYETNLRQIVNELRQAGIRPILMSPPRWGDNAPPNGLGENPNLLLEPFVKVCRRVADETGVPLADHFGHWADAEKRGIDIGDWTTDECHPNPRGHQELAAILAPVIRDVLTAQ